MQQPPNPPNQESWQQQPWQSPQYQQSNTGYLPPQQQPWLPQQPNTSYQPQPLPSQSEMYGQPMQSPPFQAYQQPMPQQLVPQRKKSKLPLILGIIAAILVLGCVGMFALVGAAAKNATTGTITTSSSNTSSTSSTSVTTTSQIAKVGQTITISGVAATLVSVKTLASDEFNKPSPGNEFIVVHVKIVNHSDIEQSYNPFDFHVKSGSGNITNETFTSTYTDNNQLQSGKLSVGGTVEGDIIFQAPKGDHKAELTWQPNFFGNSGDNGWYLGL